VTDLNPISVVNGAAEAIPHRTSSAGARGSTVSRIRMFIALSIVITFVVMTPTISRAYEAGIVDPTVAWDRAKKPIRDFMFSQIDAADNWEGVMMMLNYRGVDTSDPQRLTRADVDMLSLIPAFVISELKIALLKGFRIHLPFRVIDVVIASMLISIGLLAGAVMGRNTVSPEITTNGKVVVDLTRRPAKRMPRSAEA